MFSASIKTKMTLANSLAQASRAINRIGSPRTGRVSGHVAECESAQNNIHGVRHGVLHIPRLPCNVDANGPNPTGSSAVVGDGIPPPLEEPLVRSPPCCQVSLWKNTVHGSPQCPLPEGSRGPRPPSHIHKPTHAHISSASFFRATP